MDSSVPFDAAVFNTLPLGINKGIAWERLPLEKNKTRGFI